MPSARQGAFVALACTALASSAAAADEPTNRIGCLHMSQKVSDALAANAQSSNYNAASDEQKLGRQYCMSGVYYTGIHHYVKALDLLGVSRS